MTTITTYGPGGYDPSKPDNNVIAVETVTDPPPPPPDPTEARIAELEAEIEALTLAVLA